MTLRRAAVSTHCLFRRNRLLQIALVGAFWGVGEAASRLMGLPVPGGIIGMALALAALTWRRLPVSAMKRGADWFLAEMLLFFVPAVLAVLDHRELLSLLGVKIIAIVVLSTVVVMGVTALTIDLGYRWKVRYERANLVD